MKENIEAERFSTSAEIYSTEDFVYFPNEVLESVVVKEEDLGATIDIFSRMEKSQEVKNLAILEISRPAMLSETGLLVSKRSYLNPKETQEGSYTGVNHERLLELFREDAYKKEKDKEFWINAFNDDSVYPGFSLQYIAIPNFWFFSKISTTLDELHEKRILRKIPLCIEYDKGLIMISASNMEDSAEKIRIYDVGGKVRRIRTRKKF